MQTEVQWVADRVTPLVVHVTVQQHPVFECSSASAYVANVPAAMTASAALQSRPNRFTAVFTIDLLT
jgi:hypothetical protein